MLRCVQDRSTIFVQLKLLHPQQRRSPLKAEISQFSASSTESRTQMLFIRRFAKRCDVHVSVRPSVRFQTCEQVVTVCYNVCSQFKMLLHVLSLAGGGVSISPQFFASCTGYESASEFISRLPAGFSRHWPAKHRLTSPTTAAWYQTRTFADSALLTLELVLPQNVYAIRWQKFF